MNALDALIEYTSICGRNDVFKNTNYCVLLRFRVNTSGSTYDIRIPLQYVIERELEMTRRGKHAYSYIMRKVNQSKKSSFVSHLVSCNVLNDIVVDVDIKANWTYDHTTTERTIRILKSFYFTGMLDIPKDLSGYEILFLKYLIEKLEILLDGKCTRYESFSEVLSWSMWTTYLIYRDGIGIWIINRILKDMRRNKSIIGFVTSREDGKVRYFVDEQECEAIDVIGNQKNAISKRVINSILSDDHLHNESDCDEESHAHAIRENLVEFLRSKLLHFTSIEFCLQKVITVYATENPVSFKQRSGPVLVIQSHLPISIESQILLQKTKPKMPSIDSMNCEWVKNVFSF